MFWQAYVLGAVSTNAIENVIDKLGVVNNKQIDTFVATFYRVAIFTCASLLLGVSGVFGQLSLHFSLPIVCLAALSALSALFYTYLLKKIEISANGVLSYLTPFFFLISDLFIFHVPLGHSDIIGIILLVVGGLLFVFDFKTLSLKRQYTPLIWGISLFNLVLSGLEYYIFQYYNTSFLLNEVSYIASVWILVTLGLFATLALRQKGQLLQKKHIPYTYLKAVTISKSIDAVSAFLWFRALSLASVAQVDAMESFYPLILLLVIFIVQRLLRLDVEEDLTSSHIWGKIVGIVLLCIGGILAG